VVFLLNWFKLDKTNIYGLKMNMTFSCNTPSPPKKNEGLEGDLFVLDYAAVYGQQNANKFRFVNYFILFKRSWNTMF